MKIRNLISSIILIGICSLAVAAVGLVAYTQTAGFRSWLKDILIAEVQPLINADITIGTLDGNLFTGLELRDIVLMRDQEPIIRINRLAASYDPIAALWKEIVIHQMVVDAPELTLRMQEDQVLNISTVYQGSDTTRDTVSTVSEWTVPRTRVGLRNGTLLLEDLKTEDSRIPERIQEINLALLFAYQDGRIALSMDALSFATTNPDARIAAPRTEIGIADLTLSSDSLTISTDLSHITADLTATGQEQNGFALSLSATPLSFDDVRRFIPDLPLYGQTDLQIEVSGTPKDLTAVMTLEGKQGRIEANVQLDLSGAPIAYSASGRIRRGNPAPLLRQQELASNINIDFNVKGVGVEWGRMTAEATIKNKQSNVMSHTLDASTLQVAVHNDSLALSGRLTRGKAYTAIDGVIVLNEALTQYTIDGDFRDIDLVEFIPAVDVPSALSGSFHVSGTGMDRAQATGEMALTLSPSHVNNVPIDSLHVSAELTPLLIRLKEFQMASPVAALEVQGSWARDANLEGAFQLELKDLEPIAEFASLDTLAGTGQISGVFEGLTDSLLFDTSFVINELTVPDGGITRLTGSIAGRRTDTTIAWQLEGGIDGAHIAGQDSIDSEFSLSANADSLLDFDIDLRRPELAIRTTGRVSVQGNTYHTVVKRLGVAYAGTNWTEINGPMELDYDGTTVKVSNLALASAGQTITLSGHADTTGAGRVQVQVDSLWLATLQTMTGTQDSSLAGILDGVFTMEGPFSKPNIAGQYRLSKVLYQSAQIDQISGDLNLNNQRLTWRTRMSGLGQDSLFTLAGDLPMTFGLSPFVFSISDDDSMELALRMADLDLAISNGMVDDITDIRGRLSADFRLYNTLRDLHGSGSINIKEGAWSMASLGTKYQNVRLGLILQDNEVRLDTLSIDTGNRGQISVSNGSVALSQQSIDSFNARMNVRRFPLMNNRKMRAILDGQLTVSGSIQEPDITGVLTIPEARIYYPEWLAEDTSVILKDKPFFVIEDTLQVRPSGAARFQQVAPMERPFTETDLYQNLRTDVTLNFNRNVWLRSEEARIEIEGSLRVQKARRQDFLLFGTLSTVRGYYELQGNRFHIIEGRITFKGDPEINPDIYLEAVYAYKERTGDEVDDHEIRIIVTGAASTPQFAFTLDGQPAEQQDIFSVLLFGKTFNNLSIGQQSRITENASTQDAATRFVSAQVIRRITRQLEQQLKLDMLQIDQKDGGFRGTRVQAGKYLTSGIFVSVSQALGNEGEQRVELEYKIPQSFVFLDLFLRALRERTGSSGVDLVWKLEW